MSEARHFIELAAPSIVNRPGETVTERMAVPGLRCGYCKGQGEVLRYNEATQEWEYSECPVCHGGGKLDATVTVEWKPIVKDWQVEPKQ